MGNGFKLVQFGDTQNASQESKGNKDCETGTKIVSIESSTSGYQDGDSLNELQTSHYYKFFLECKIRRCTYKTLHKHKQL